jgi:hypothetical protein
MAKSSSGLPDDAAALDGEAFRVPLPMIRRAARNIAAMNELGELIRTYTIRSTMLISLSFIAHTSFRGRAFVWVDGVRGARNWNGWSRSPGAGLYSITPSAWASIKTGILRPRALAVLRLITSSTLVLCWIGRSAGLAPLRIFPT